MQPASFSTWKQNWATPQKKYDHFSKYSASPFPATADRIRKQNSLQANEDELQLQIKINKKKQQLKMFQAEQMRRQNRHNFLKSETKMEKEACILKLRTILQKIRQENQILMQSQEHMKTSLSYSAIQENTECDFHQILSELQK